VRALRPRVLFVARTRYELPLAESLRRKWDALADVLEPRVLAASTSGSQDDGRFSLAGAVRPKALDGPLFYLALPLRVARELRAAPTAAIVAQSPYEGAAAAAGRALARSRVPLAVEIHGDWRTFTRLYGSPLRRLLTRLADGLAARVVRRADAVRSVSPYTSRLVRELGREPDDEFAAYMDLDAFLGPVAPLPERPTALFVGVLERYKNLDGLVAAWRRAGGEVPGARLHLVGEGTLRPLVEELVAERPEQVTWTPRLSTPEVAAALDEASFLVLPSRSEGMGRVIVEAFCRGRGVLGAGVGGIADLVRPDENGLLVPPEPGAIADGLTQLLRDPGLVARVGAGARRSADELVVTPEAFAARTAALVDRLARP
jgi:glycosyltransferase involved in cell wall biosynthesis